jgi:hypothetical protein
MSQFMVSRYNGGDRPETDYYSVDAEDEPAAAMKTCGGEPLIRGGEPGDLRALVKCVPARGRPIAFHRTPGGVP